MKNFSEAYNEESFWGKIKKYAIRAGEELIEKVLILYYCLQNPHTPLWVKTAIIGALGYFIFPFDAIPDFIPGIGYTDDLTIIAAVLLTIAAYITPEIKKKAKEILEILFGPIIIF